MKLGYTGLTYAAPEIFKGELNYKCDVWSCGIIMYILLCGKHLFAGETQEEIIENIHKNQLFFDENFSWKIRKPAKNLITFICDMLDRKI